MTKQHPPLACVILTAGQGTRMKSDLPKVMHQVANRPMVQHVLEACAGLLPERVVVVVAPQSDLVTKAVAPHTCAVQEKALGTGDAVKAAKQALKDFSGDVLVLFGDTPLVTAEALELLRQRKQESGAAIVVSGFQPDDAASYGRLILDAAGKLQKIVEWKDATEAERAVRLCNGGIMLFSSDRLWGWLDRVNNNNAKGEYYLTDVIGLARQDGAECAVAEIAPEQVLGINSRVELSVAERIMQQRLRETAMMSGVTMVDPDSVFLSADTRFGRDVTIAPHVVFGAGVEVGGKVDIRAFCHLEQVRVDDGAQIGPFARLRPGSVIGVGAHIGNFVEIKNAEVGAGAKINHLSYIGDAYIGDRANIGAGTITCNYDGFKKMHTHVGAEAFVGSNSSLVAPVKIGDGAYVGAGSTITEEVPAHTLAVARGRQSNIDGWAQRFRKSKGDK